MAVILTHDCPRCGGNNLGFTYVAVSAANAPKTQHVMFKCPKCTGPTVAKIHNEHRIALDTRSGDLRDTPGITVIWVEPPPHTQTAPEHTPAAVAEYYVEACDSLHRQKWTSAASMLRKCMEVSLKQFAPDVEAWKLERRIEKLANEHLITPALRDWANELRLDGNEALHGTEPATEELATRMERLTYFLLVYLYTLPAQVKQASVEREDGN